MPMVVQYQIVDDKKRIVELMNLFPASKSMGMP